MKEFFYKLYYSLIGKFAHNYIKKYKPYVIGINGSVGKTSCRMILSQTLKKVIPQQYSIYTSPNNFNGEVGLPLSILKIEESPTSTRGIIKMIYKIWRRSNAKKLYDCIILEYGIDRPKEMEFLLSIVKPDIGIFTKIDSVHSEQFGTPQAIAEEEVKMIKATKETAFLNADDTYARQVGNMIKIEKFFYTTTEEDSEQYPENVSISYKDEKILKDIQDIVSSTFTACNNKKNIAIQTNLVGRENYGYISLSFAICSILYYKITKKDLYEYFEKIYEKHAVMYCRYKLLPGRLSLFQGIQNSILLDSSYNSSPLSMRKIIETAYSIKQKAYQDHKILFVMGDMRELGQFTEQDHRRIAGPLHMVADHIVLVGELTKKYTFDELCKIGTGKNLIFCYNNAISAAEHVKNLLYDSNEKRIVVCKGSQNTIFLEETVKKLLPKKERKHSQHYLCRQSDERRSKKKKILKKLKKSA